MSASTRFTLLAITLIAVALPTAYAQTATPQAQPAASTAPQADQRTGWEEYRTMMAANFERLDANKDGVLESTEIPNQPAGQRVTRAQFDGHLREGFDRLDADKDGDLAASELPARKTAPPQK